VSAAPRSLGELLDAAAERWPDKPAVVFKGFRSPT
jgi:hypothetical protein